jgi:hypothetical protein
MSIITPEEKATVVRFTHLSLLALGTATAILFLSFPGIVAAQRAFGLRWGPGVAGAFLLTGWALLTRRVEFSDRALRVPFDMGAAALNKASDATPVLPASPERRRVYLAGGHRSGWQQSIMNAAPGFDYFDPRSHGLDDPRSYTVWDLNAIDQSDILFVYFEATNPSGFGLSLEVGSSSLTRSQALIPRQRSIWGCSMKPLR